MDGVRDVSAGDAVGAELSVQECDLVPQLMVFVVEFAEDGRRRKGDDRARALRVATCRSRLEPAAVVAVSIQDLSPLRGVHEMAIGPPRIAL